MLIYGEFEHTSAGFKYIGRAWAEPSHAFVAAHDMLEHFPDDTGCLEDELRALGSGLWLRDAFGGLPARMVSSDIIYVLGKYLTENGLREPPKGRLHTFAERATEMIGFMEGHDNLSSQVKANFNKAIGWAKLGLAQSLDRYAGCDHYTVSRLFERVKDYFANCSWYTDNPNATISVVLDPKAGEYATEYKLKFPNTLSPITRKSIEKDLTR